MSKDISRFLFEEQVMKINRDIKYFNCITYRASTGFICDRKEISFQRTYKNTNVDDIFESV